MIYTRSQNYTNTMVSEHGIQTFEVVVVALLLLLLLFGIFVPTSKCPFFFVNKCWFVQICLNVSSFIVHDSLQVQIEAVVPPLMLIMILSFEWLS